MPIRLSVVPAISAAFAFCGQDVFWGTTLLLTKSNHVFSNLTFEYVSRLKNDGKIGKGLDKGYHI